MIRVFYLLNNFIAQYLLLLLYNSKTHFPFGLNSINLTRSITSSNISQNLKNHILCTGIFPSIFKLFELSIIIQPIGILFRIMLEFSYYLHYSELYGATNIIVQPLGFAATFMSPFQSVMSPSCVNLWNFIYFQMSYMNFMYYQIFFLQFRMLSLRMK